MTANVHANGIEPRRSTARRRCPVGNSNRTRSGVRAWAAVSRLPKGVRLRPPRAVQPTAMSSKRPLAPCTTGSAFTTRR